MGVRRKKKAGWIRRPPKDTDRFEACFSGAPFSPHRHDTYTFCVTVSGVQSFDYRGTTRHSQARGVIVLHPDEVHDGRAGSDTPFRYRALNVSPARIQSIIGCAPLPYLPGGTSTDPRLHHAVENLLLDFERPLETFEYEDGLFLLATTLAEVCGRRYTPTPRFDDRAALRAREYIDANVTGAVTMASLEAATGRDRWQLSRDFRAAFGTSPYRYALLRRLDRAKTRLEQGMPGADVAAETGFADQSHLIRHFRRAFGLSPSQWCRFVQSGHQPHTIVQ